MLFLSKRFAKDFWLRKLSNDGVDEVKHQQSDTKSDIPHNKAIQRPGQKDNTDADCGQDVEDGNNEGKDKDLTPSEQ